MNIEIDKLNSDRVISIVYNRLLESRHSNSRPDGNNGLTKESHRPEIKDIMEGLKKIADASDVINKKVRLSFNEDINRVIITIFNKETNEVLEEIPCQELQELALHLKEAIGILFDRTA